MVPSHKYQPLSSVYAGRHPLWSADNRIKHAWSRDHVTSSVTAVLPPAGQHCGTICLNSFGNLT